MNNSEYVTKPVLAKAFQWKLEAKLPDWFNEALEQGKAFVVINHQKKSYYIYTENKRGKYKGFLGDWVVKDEFGHLHVVSESTFKERYDRVDQRAVA